MVVFIGHVCLLASVKMLSKVVYRVQAPPLGRVFKIHDFFLHDFIGCLLSVSGMLLWVTPNGVIH